MSETQKYNYKKVLNDGEKREQIVKNVATAFEKEYGLPYSVSLYKTLSILVAKM